MYAPLKVLLSLGGLTPGELARRVWREMGRDDILNRAAILGFYFMLALFPLLLCLTALMGLFAQTGTELRDQLFSYLARVAPRSAYALVYETVGEVNSEIEKAAAKAGEPEAKLPGEKSPGEIGSEGRKGAAAA